MIRKSNSTFENETLFLSALIRFAGRSYDRIGIDSVTRTRDEKINSWPRTTEYSNIGHINYRTLSHGIHLQTPLRKSILHTEGYSQFYLSFTVGERMAQQRKGGNDKMKKKYEERDAA